MNKLLIISGPTATGKTAIAVKLAKKYGGELISTDSRQIYRGLDIGVGKDHPQNTPIHLIDIINPDQIYSVAEFSRLALSKIQDLTSRNLLPILVGCSGQYIDGIISPRPTYEVKPNLFLRTLLNYLPLPYLQFILKMLDYKTYSSLNQSDVQNPRRLIRRIEIKLSKKQLVYQSTPNFNILHLSLTAPNQYLFPRINARVDERLRIGHLKELNTLLKKYSWDSPGLKVSAYQVFKPYFQKTATFESCVQRWKYLEHRDARHQKTWFKKNPSIHFFDISQSQYPRNLQAIIQKWYNKP